MRWILCLLIIVVMMSYLVCGDDILYCKPAEEGKPFSVSFTTNYTSDVSWHVTYKNGTTEELSRCPAHQTYCLDRFSHYTASRHTTGRDVTHSLILSHVNASHHEMTLSASSDVTSDLYSCRMDVYTEPRGGECHASLVDNNTNHVTPYKVNVTYTASGVFPNVTCLMNQYEVNTRQSETVSRDQIRVRHVRESRDYCRVTCDAELSVDQPGVYVYTTVVKPQLAGHHVIDVPHLRPVNSLRLDVGRSVQLLPPPTPALEVCEDEFVTVSFVCKAWDFLSDDIFSWSVGGEQVGQESFTSTKSDTHLESVLTLRISNKYHNKKVVCQAQDTSMKFAIEKSHSLKLIHPPTSRPTFEAKSGGVISDHVVFTAGEKLDLDCVAKGGYPEKGATNVECFDEVFDHGTVLEEFMVSSDTNRATFELSSPENQTYYCTCKFSHVSKCRSPERTEIKISFQKLLTSEYLKVTEQSSEVKISVGYFILVIVLSALVAFIFSFTLSFLFKKVKAQKEGPRDSSSKGHKRLLLTSDV